MPAKKRKPAPMTHMSTMGWVTKGTGPWGTGRGRKMTRHPMAPGNGPRRKKK